MKPPGNPANAHSITMSAPDPSGIVHRQHPSSPKLQAKMAQSFQRLLRLVYFQRRSAPRSGAVLSVCIQTCDAASDEHSGHSSEPRESPAETAPVSRLRQTIIRRRAVSQNLCQCVPVNVVLGTRCPLAQLAARNPTANLNPQLHVSEHSCPPQSARSEFSGNPETLPRQPRVIT